MLTKKRLTHGHFRKTVNSTMDLAELIEVIRHDKDYQVRPANKNIALPAGTPEDLKLFYELTDGIFLFPNEPYGIDIVSRPEFQRANPTIVGQNCEDGISCNWFIVRHVSEQYISIDLSKQRVGKCYDSFWETHGLVGNTPVIAENFTDLLTNLYRHRGQYWYWLQPDFKNLGDAYD